MSPGTFAHPEWLSSCAWVTAATALAFLLARRAASRRSRRLLGRREPPQAGAFTSDLALFVAFVAVVVALLGPRLGERTLWVRSDGVDVVFLLDVSRSMDAKDVPPNRLDRARRTVAELLGRLRPGDRAALAAFAGRGLLLTPLTPDRGALDDLLEGIESGFIRPASSNLGNGIRAAITAFEPGSERPRVLVVTSDGEATRRRSDLGITQAQRENVRVITAALGSDAGSAVPDGGRTLRSRSGSPITSRRNVVRLAKLAAATGGKAFVGDEWGRIDLDAAAAEIRRGVGPGGEPVERRVAALRVAPFAALAFVLLLIEGVPRPSRFRKSGAILACAAVLAQTLLAAAWPPASALGADEGHAALAAAARVADEPENARALIDLGLVHLEQGRNDSASRAFLAATIHARDNLVAAVAHYDAGVVALEDGELETARDEFFDSLSLDPSSRAARFNLEWTLAAIRSRSSEPAQEPDEIPAANASLPPDRPEGGEDERPAEDRATGAANENPIEVMSDEQRQRWLARAHDDAGRWLRAVAEEPEASPASSEEPVW